MSGIKGKIIYDEHGNEIGRTGAAKAAATNRERHGEDHFKKIGSIGGKRKSPLKGFGGMTPEKRIEAGRRGGTISRRGPAKVKEA